MMPLLQGKPLTVVPRLLRLSVTYLLLTGGNGAAVADLAEVQPLDLLLPLTVNTGVVSFSFFS